jgi:hypothetical protein
MEGSIECLGEVEGVLKETFCEFGIAGANFINADHQSSLVFLQHQYNL